MLFPIPTTTATVVSFIGDIGVWSKPIFDEMLSWQWFAVGFAIVCIILGTITIKLWDKLDDLLGLHDDQNLRNFRVERKQFFMGPHGAKSGEIFTERHYDEKFKFFKL